MTALKVPNIELEVIAFKICGLVGLKRVCDLALLLDTEFTSLLMPLVEIGKTFSY